jgi:hypothetical protein
VVLVLPISEKVSKPLYEPLSVTEPVPVVVVSCFTLSLTTRAILGLPSYTRRMMAVAAAGAGNWIVNVPFSTDLLPPKSRTATVEFDLDEL